MEQQPSASEQHQSAFSSETRLAARSAKPEDTPDLKVQTVGPANGAYLEQDAGGLVRLYFRGLHFGVDDNVPNSVTGSLSFSPGGTAGQFVCKQMLLHYGYHEDGWPTLARHFMLQHTTPPPAKR